MKPVTDPALLAQLESQSGGVPAPVAGPKPVTDPALLAQLEGGKPGLSAKGQAYRVGGGGAEAPAWYEELGGGLKHSLDKSALGLEKSVKWAANKIPGVNWEVDPENVENVQRGREFVKGTGALSTVGEVGGDILQGVAAGGPASLVKGGAGLVGKVLPAAVDIASQAGWGALTAPEDKGEAAALGGGGAAVGRVLPHAVSGARKAAGAVTDIVMPGRSAAGRIARHLGPEEYTRVGEAVKKGVEAGDSILPQTTAAMSDSTRLASLERGARGRGLVDLTKKNAATEAAKASQLTKLTGAAEGADDLAREADAVVAEGKRRLGNMPLGKERKAGIVAELESLKTRDEILGSTSAMSAVDQAIKAIDNPNSSTRILVELRENMGKNPKLQPVKDLLMEAANERSKSIASMAEEGASAIRGQAEAGMAAKKLRGEYLDEAGGSIKGINEMSLNKSLTKPGLSEDIVKGGRALSEEVRKSNLYKTAEGPTEIKSRLKSVDNPIAAAITSYTTGGWSAPVHLALGVRDHYTKKAVDKAIADPTEFLKIFNAKKASGEAIAVWEKKLAKTLRPMTIAGGVAGRELGEE
jgi:hypothetical protein